LITGVVRREEQVQEERRERERTKEKFMSELPMLKSGMNYLISRSKTPDPYKPSYIPSYQSTTLFRPEGNIFFSVAILNLTKASECPVLPSQRHTPHSTHPSKRGGWGS